MTHAFENRGIESNGMLHLSPKEALESCKEGALLLDVRDLYEVEARQFEVPEFIWIPLAKLEAEIDKLPKDQPIIVADSVGIRSKKAVYLLLEKEFTKIANMAGGIKDWETDGMPILLDKGSMLHAPCACMIHQKKSEK